MKPMEMIFARRSVRKYTSAPIPEDVLDSILHAGLAAASSKNRRPWEFVLVRSRDTLDQLCTCRPGASNLLIGCNAAIVVCADQAAVDVWVEDCASAMTQMHLAADALGVGSCWLQIRLRQAEDGRSSTDVVRSVLGIPEHLGVMGILALGMPAEHAPARTAADLPLHKIHREHF